MLESMKVYEGKFPGIGHPAANCMMEVNRVSSTRFGASMPEENLAKGKVYCI